MSDQTSLSPDQRPTNVRHPVVAVTTLMALILYLDRLCVSIASEYIREDLRMTQTEMSWFLSAFFWSYALAQVPAGLFSDRFGARRMLTIYIIAWSAFTGLLGLAQFVGVVLLLRFLCGVFQAGAYPTAGGLIRVWYPLSTRGIANSIVALGGRTGGVLAPILTAWLISVYAGAHDPTSITKADILDYGLFLKKFDVPGESPQAAVVKRVMSHFPDHVLQMINQEQQRVLQQPSEGSRSASGTSPQVAPATQELLDQIQRTLKQHDLFDGVDVSDLKLSPEALALAETRSKPQSLTDQEVALFNRLVLEAPFAGAIRRHIGTGWRPTMILYGMAGIAVAAAYWLVARNSPVCHPWCNDSEREFISGGTTSGVQPPVHDAPFPLRAMLTDVSLWGNSLMQILTNIGWVFVVTWLPRYLKDVHAVPLNGQALMTAIPTAAGIFGMYAGGWWTDRSTSRHGRMWGRRLPVVVTRFTAAAGYGICLLLGLWFVPGASHQSWLPWAYVGGLCLMVFSVDMGNPAVWAYAQDVGGKYTGSILGWANMWGNLGAAAAPLIYNRVLGEHPTGDQWNWMFAVCLLAFVLSGLCGLVMDSTKPLVREVER